jgi:putative methionine-R-sulfoxide reductase with GAF domain
LPALRQTEILPMDRYTILSDEAPVSTLPPVPDLLSDADRQPEEEIRFPAEDQGRSLAEMAVRDLSATLQLLAERARYVTGASAAAIALKDGSQLVCRASSGPPAPNVGVMPVLTGLPAESIRTGKTLRSDDLIGDARVKREGRELPEIASGMVMPLFRQQELIGIFEVFSGQPAAFAESDVMALQRLGEMILTAIDQAEAARQVLSRAILEKVLPAEPQSTGSFETHIEAVRPEETSSIMRGSVGRCSACGFPVSGARNLCVDCEAVQESPFVGEIGEAQKSDGLSLKQKYLLGAALGALAAGLVWRLR